MVPPSHLGSDDYLAKMMYYFKLLPDCFPTRIPLIDGATRDPADVASHPHETSGNQKFEATVIIIEDPRL
jgi:hypothetical protein